MEIHPQTSVSPLISKKPHRNSSLKDLHRYIFQRGKGINTSTSGSPCQSPSRDPQPSPPMSSSRSSSPQRCNSVKSFSNINTTPNLSTTHLPKFLHLDPSLVTPVAPVTQINVGQILEIMKISRPSLSLSIHSSPRSHSNSSVDKVLLGEIRKSLKREPILPTPSIWLFCRIVVEQWDFSFNIGEIIGVDFLKAKEIWNLLQRGDLLLYPFWSRIKVIDKIMIEYLKKRETGGWSTELFNYLTRLYEVVNIKEFLLHLHSSDSYLTKIGKWIMGSTKVEREASHLNLKKWMDPAMIDIVKLRLREFIWEKVAILTLPNRRYESEVLTRISEISVSDILLALSRYKSITINSVPFLLEGIPREKYLTNIFEIFMKYYPLLTSPKELTNYYLIFESFPWSSIENRSEQLVDGEIKSHPLWAHIFPFYSNIIDGHRSKESLVAETLVPFTPVLRLITINCWFYGDELLHRRFPGLFIAPYWTKAQGGSSCAITFKDPNNYYVIQEITYNIYHRLVPHSQAVDRDKSLATFLLSWTVERVGDDHIGKLRIKDLVISSSTSLEDKWDIYRILST